MGRTTAQAAVASTRCPDCDAPPMLRCRQPDGFTFAAKTHAARVRAYKAAHPRGGARAGAGAPKKAPTRVLSVRVDAGELAAADAAVGRERVAAEVAALVRGLAQG